MLLSFSQWFGPYTFQFSVNSCIFLMLPMDVHLSANPEALLKEYFNHLFFSPPFTTPLVQAAFSSLFYNLSGSPLCFLGLL
jgi:hypothetical protein